MISVRRPTAMAIAAALTLALTGALVLRTSSAVFTAGTENSGNSLEAGTVVLTDDDGDDAALRMRNFAPGESSRECIVVEYDGTLDPEAVKVHSSSNFRTTPDDSGPGTAARDMQDQVSITIEQGDGTSTGGFGDCSGFSPGATIVDGQNLASWNGSATGYTTGSGTWNPGEGPDVPRMYRITLTLDQDTGNDFQGARLDGIEVTWSTRSTASPGLVS